MDGSARRRQILAWLQAAGHLQVRELVDRFNVSEMTIRRDLDLLEDAGALVRTYGGAVPVTGLTREPPYHTKVVERVSEKERIAREAAKLVQDGDFVLLDAGSTTAAVARQLLGLKRLTVITFDLKIAVELCDEPNVRLLVAGGEAQKEGYNLFGPLAEQTLRGITVDLAFLGTSAVHPKYGLTTPTLSRVPLKQAMLRAARRSVLVADASKFGRRSSFQICPVASLTDLITDSSLSPEMVEATRKEGISLVLA